MDFNETLNINFSHEYPKTLLIQIGLRKWKSQKPVTEKYVTKNSLKQIK